MGGGEGSLEGRGLQGDIGGPACLLLVDRLKNVLRGREPIDTASCLQMWRLNFDLDSVDELFRYINKVGAENTRDITLLRAMYIQKVMSWNSVGKDDFAWHAVVNSFKNVAILEQILNDQFDSDMQLARANSGVAFLRHFMSNSAESDDLSLAVDMFSFKMENSIFVFDAKTMSELR